MAGREPSISRRRVLGAAAALPLMSSGGAIASAAPSPSPSPSRSRRLWDRRLARYRRLAAETARAAEVGWFREANDRFDREKEAAEGAPDAEALRAAAWRRMDAAEDSYWHRCTAPMQEAAAALARTAAPDLEALRDKIGVIRAVRLHELECGGDCFEVLEADVGRLIALAAGGGSG